MSAAAQCQPGQGHVVANSDYFVTVSSDGEVQAFQCLPGTCAHSSRLLVASNRIRVFLRCEQVWMRAPAMARATPAARTTRSACKRSTAARLIATPRRSSAPPARKASQSQSPCAATTSVTPRVCCSDGAMSVALAMARDGTGSSSVRSVYQIKLLIALLLQ